MPGVTYDQLMRAPTIMRTVQQIHNPGNTLQRFYGLGPMSNPMQTIRGRVGVYDIFNGTRSLAPSRAPMTGPTRINRKPVGQGTITVMRTYTALAIEDEYVFATRPLGGQFGEVDEMGRGYIARQLAYAKSLHENNHEFMASRMFAGGWGLRTDGENMNLVATASGTDISVSMQVPAAHTGQLAVGSGGANVIGTSWATSNADLIAQLMQLQHYAAKVNGRRLKHIWVNGNTGQYLFKNSVIQAVGGSVYRIFDTLNPNTEITEGQKFPDTGVSVVFRGLPDYTFHIYNQGYVSAGTGESFSAQTGANWTPFIPDNVAIITPDPGDWCGLVAGSEPVQYSLKEQPRIQTGFGMGVDREIDPPRYDLKMLNNAAPALFEPYACYYATVIGF